MQKLKEQAEPSGRARAGEQDEASSPGQAASMKALIQRVSKASVRVGDEVVGKIGPGLVILLGIARDDSDNDAQALAGRVLNMRVFADADSKFNLSALDTGAELLVVSQFTLLADTAKGRRPSFSDAAPPELAEPLCRKFTEALKTSGLKVETGRFGAHMQVEIHNDGPVTLWLETKKWPDRDKQSPG